MSFSDSLAALKKSATENPTEFIKAVGMGLIRDPELLHPALWSAMPVKIAAAISKAGIVAKVAETGVRGAAIGAGAEAGTELIEGKDINSNKVLHEAEMWGAMGAGGHAIAKGVSAGVSKFKAANAPKSTFTPEQAADLMGDGPVPERAPSSILKEEPKIEASLKESIEELHSKHGSKKDLAPEAEATLLEPTWKEAHSNAAKRFVAKSLKDVPDGPRRDQLARELFEEFDAQSSSYKPKPVVTEADLAAAKEAGEARTVDRTSSIKAESQQAAFLRDQQALQEAGAARTVDTTASKIADAKRRLFEKDQQALREAGEARTVDVSASERAAAKQRAFEGEQQALREAGEARLPNQDVAAQNREAKALTEGEARATTDRILQEGADARPVQNPTQPAKTYEQLRKAQGGSVDPRLAGLIGVTSMGAVVGAVLDTDNPIAGSLFGGGAALLALKSPSAVRKLMAGAKDVKEVTPTIASATVKGIDYLVGQVGTRISNISPRIGLKAVENEMKILSDVHKGVSIGDPFIRAINKLPTIDKELINNALLNGRFSAVRGTLSGEALASFDGVVHVLKHLGKEASARGIIKGELENYFPRMVKDLEGLRKVLNVEHSEGLTKVILEKGRTLGRALTPEEEAKVVNSYILGKGDTTAFKPGFTKGRSLGQLSAELAKFYHSPEQAYHSYVQRMTHEIHTHDFFGKSAKTGEGGLDLDASIGNYMTAEVEAGRLTWEGAERLSTLFKARYRAGQVASHPGVQEVKNWTTALVLGDVVSAASNLSGPIMAGFRYGTMPGLKATLMSAREMVGSGNKLPISVKDYGLLDTISEEFVNTSRSQVYTRNIMKAAGWGKLDSFEKNTQFNASLLRAQNLAKSDAGITKLTSLYKKEFGETFPKLVSDLKNGVISNEVKLMSFFEVSKQQPLTKLQRSQFGLEHPNIGGLTLQFKSWMMSQANAVRTESFNLVKSGMQTGDTALVKRGLGNLARLGSAYAIMGVSTTAITNLILGRPVDIDTNDVVTGAFKQIGYNDYTAKKFRDGKLDEAMGDYLIPPGVNVVMDIVSREPDKILRHFPVVGRTLAARSESGKERFETTQTKEKRAKATDSVKEEYSEEDWKDMSANAKGKLVKDKMMELGYE